MSRGGFLLRDHPCRTHKLLIGSDLLNSNNFYKIFWPNHLIKCIIIVVDILSEGVSMILRLKFIFSHGG
jgi:hypothetical protein